MRLAQLIVAIVLLSSSAVADAPIRYYCNGAVVNFAGDWHEVGDSLYGLEKSKPLKERPAACPAYAANYAVTDGLGFGQMPVEPAPTGTAVDVRSSYYYSERGRPIASLGVIGVLLAQRFGGPPYTPKTDDIKTELSRIRGLANTMRYEIEKDTRYVGEQTVSTGASVARENAAGRLAIANGAYATDVAHNAALTALNARLAKASAAVDASLSEALPSLEQGQIRGELGSRLGDGDLRPEGRSILGMLDERRVPGYEALVAQERARLAKAMAAGDASKPAYKEAKQSLDAADRFAASGTKDGEKIAKALLKQAQSARLAGQGRGRNIEVAVLKDDGSITFVIIHPGGPLPGESILASTTQFETNRLAAAASYEALQKRAADPTLSALERERAANAAEAGQRLSEGAAATFYDGELQAGHGMQGIGIAVMDVGLGLIPGVGWAKDAYEFATGKSLLTGETLSTEDRAFALVGVATLGLGSELKLGKTIVMKGIERVAPYVGKLTEYKAARAYLLNVYAKLSIDGLQITRGVAISGVTDGFRSAARAAAHQKHADKMGLNMKEYVKAAQNFAGRKAEYDFVLQRPNGEWVKWNPLTREFGVFNGSNVDTYFITNKGKKFDYFIKQYAKEVDGVLDPSAWP